MLLCSSRHDIIIKQGRDERGKKRGRDDELEIVGVNENILQAALHKEEERVTTYTVLTGDRRRQENCLSSSLSVLSMFPCNPISLVVTGQLREET